MANKAQVLACWRAHPDWTSTMMADEIGCAPEYVRATLTRNGIRLARRHDGNSVYALGRAAAQAGMTVADIESWARSRRGDAHA